MPIACAGGVENRLRIDIAGRKRLLRRDGPSRQGDETDENSENPKGSSHMLSFSFHAGCRTRG